MKFLVNFFIAFFLSISIYIFLSMKLTVAPIEAEYWIREMIVVKRNLILNIKEKERILIFGGSSSLFGISAKDIGQQLHVPVFNYGLHGGLKLAFILNEARLYSRDGDVIILALEDRYFCEKNSSNEWNLVNEIAWNHENSKNISLLKRSGGIEYFSPNIVRDMLIALYFQSYYPKHIERRLESFNNELIINKFNKIPKSDEFEYSAYNINYHGDIENNKGAFYYDPIPGRSVEICQKSTDDLITFIEQSEKKNIKVIFINTPWPIFPDANLQEIGVNHDLKISGAYIDGAIDSSLPREMFFNTPQHLNIEGRSIRTKKLIQSICKKPEIFGFIDRQYCQ